MTGRTLRGGAAAVLLLLALAGGPREAHATSLANLTVEQFTDASTWIVEGQVKRVWTEFEADRGIVWTKAEVALTEVHKGPDQRETLIVESLGGKHGDVLHDVPGRPSFSVGESVFLFLDEVGEETKRLVPVSMHLGKLTIRRASGERRHHVMHWQARRSETYDHRFLPHPPPENRVYLDDLRERVQSRLDVGWDGLPIPGISDERLKTVNKLERRIPR